jgi:hypothetical protein
MTIVLPRWFQILEELSLTLRMIPCDVSTRWNSTYDMLSFILEHKAAIIKMTGEQEMKLRKYKLDKREWDLIDQLCKALKACSISSSSYGLRNTVSGFQGCNVILFS